MSTPIAAKDKSIGFASRYAFVEICCRNARNTSDCVKCTAVVVGGPRSTDGVESSGAESDGVEEEDMTVHKKISRCYARQVTVKCYFG